MAPAQGFVASLKFATGPTIPKGEEWHRELCVISAPATQSAPPELKTPAC